MSKPTIYILHRPTNSRLCKNGVFLPFYSACGSKDDTLVYRQVSAALRRVNSKTPGKRLRDTLIGDVVLEIVDGDRVYYKDRFMHDVT